MAVDAVVYYHVFNPIISVVNIANAHYSTRLLAQTTLRNVLGTKNLSEILSDRENISQFMQVCASNSATFKSKIMAGISILLILPPFPLSIPFPPLLYLRSRPP